jgi:hypothetical protein
VDVMTIHFIMPEIKGFVQGLNLDFLVIKLVRGVVAFHIPYPLLAYFYISQFAQCN